MKIEGYSIQEVKVNKKTDEKKVLEEEANARWWNILWLCIGGGVVVLLAVGFFIWVICLYVEERMKKAFLNRELQLDAFKPN